MQKKKILFLTANPKDTEALKLQRELNAIRDVLLRAKYRDQYTVEYLPAANREDLLQYLLDFKPNLMHFCGHGEYDGIFLHDDSDNKAKLETEALSDLFEYFAKHGLECVVLNSCYSETQANAISKHIDYVIGLHGGVQDDDAIKFSKLLYMALGAGETYEGAYECARRACPRLLKPVLRTKADNSPCQVQIILAGEVERFDATTREHLMTILAALLKIELHAVKVLSVASGSVKLILELPRGKARELIELFKTDEEEFKKLSAPVHIIDIIIPVSTPPTCDSAAARLKKRLNTFSERVTVLTPISSPHFRSALLIAFVALLLVTLVASPWKDSHSASEVFRILIADFEGPKLEGLDFTRDIIVRLKKATSDSMTRVEIKHLNQIIPHEDDDYAHKIARELGKKQDADLVVWGWYQKLSGADDVSFFVIFEILPKSPQYLPVMSTGDLVSTLTTKIDDLGNFSFQTKLSKQMSSFVFLVLGSIHLGRSKYEDAVKAYTDALKHPVSEGVIDSAGIYLSRGTAYLLKGDLHNAKTDIDLAIRLKPDFASAFNNRGIVKLNQSDLKNAIADFTMATRLKPKNAPGYINLGVALKLKGDTSAAFRNFEIARKLNPDDPVAITHEAIIRAEHGQTQAAIKALKHLLVKDANNSQVHVNLGLLYLQKGVVDSAIISYNKAINLDKNNASAFFFRGQAYHTMNESKKALSDFNRVIALQSHNAEAFYHLGLVYSAMRNWNNAIASFDQAAKYNPTKVEPYFKRGQHYFDIKNWDLAIRDFSKVLELQPENADALYYRGRAYSAKTEYAKAIADFNLLLKQQPQNWEVILHRGLAYHKSGQFDNAIGDLRQIIAWQPCLVSVYHHLGSAYYALGNDGEAQAFNAKAVECKPDTNFPPYSQIAHVNSFRARADTVARAMAERVEAIKRQADDYCQKGDSQAQRAQYRPALKSYSQALKLMPELAECCSKRGRAHFALANYDSAIIDFSKTIALESNQAEAYFNRGRSYHAKKNYPRALADYEEADKRGYAEAKKHHTYALAESGDHGSALAVWTEAISRNPDNAELHIERGKVFARKGDFQGAIADYTAATKDQGKFAEALYLRGSAYHELREYEKAIADLESASTLNQYEACTRLGRVYADKKNYDRAMNQLNACVKRRPGTEAIAFQELALHFMGRGTRRDLEMAEALTKRSLRYSRNNPYTLDTLAEIYFRLADYETDYHEKAKRENQNALQYAKTKDLIKELNDRARKLAAGPKG